MVVTFIQSLFLVHLNNLTQDLFLSILMIIMTELQTTYIPMYSELEQTLLLIVEKHIITSQS